MNMSECKVEGRYENWSIWSPCSVTCSSCEGLRVRERTCVSPFQDPTSWGVEAVTGLPELLCFDKRMKDEESCAGVEACLDDEGGLCGNNELKSSVAEEGEAEDGSSYL